MGWLIAAYTVVWTSVIAYLINVSRTRASLERQRRDLE